VGSLQPAAITTSGSPASLLAHCQIDAPRAQCSRAACISSHCGHGILRSHDQVDVVAAAQAMIGDGQQTVGVGRKIDPGHLALAGEQRVDEARTLMAVAVMILLPDVMVSR